MTQTRKFVDATNEGKSVGLATIDVDVKHCDWNRIRLDQWKTIAQVTASENQINVLVRKKLLEKVLLNPLLCRTFPMLDNTVN